jgi:hypothetical protein
MTETEMADLSTMEEEALCWLKGQGGSVLITAVSEKNTRGVFGMEPGLTVFKKLAKKGLVLITEEEPFQLEDGTWFTYTPSIDIL